MPRDFLADKTLESMPQLSREPAATSPPPEQRKANPYGTSLIRVEDPFKKMVKKDIHPFSSLLSIDDLDDCDWLEHAAFDPIEAASREKVSRFPIRLPHDSQTPTLSRSSAACCSSALLFWYLMRACAHFHTWCHLMPQHRLCARMPLPHTSSHLCSEGANIISAAFMLSHVTELALRCINTG